MTERARRVIAKCRRIAELSEELDRTTRRFLTPPVREVHALLRSRMESLGMVVALDAVGNLRGMWKPAGSGCSRFMIGSHIDTVPDAGAFDGVLGVVMALELVEISRQRGLPLPLEVIAFSEEEGVRFGVPFLGSRAAAGHFDPALLALKDAAGVTLESAIREFGLDPSEIANAAIGDEIAGYFEIHIEQGPVLESEGLSVAAVTSIAGQSRFELTMMGHANHAGTTPMKMRRDALAGAAEWISTVETLAAKTDGLVATVGQLELQPNAGNVIPGEVKLSFEVRHAKDRVRKEAVEMLLDLASSIATRRKLRLEHTLRLDQPAVPMDEQLTSFLADAIEAAGLPMKQMPSGAGHDAMVMASRLPTAMLFLRSPGGISHHPDESVLEEDVENALNVGRIFLERVAAQVR